MPSSPPGGRYQALVTAKIRTYGQLLTVNRRGSGGPGTLSLTQTLYAIPELDNKSIEVLQAQGDMNAANQLPMIFVFAGTSDVREVVDLIQYNGWNYRITRAAPMDVSGITVSLHCWAVRETPVNG